MSAHRDAITRAMEAAEGGDYDGAWAQLTPLRSALGQDADLAWAWCVLEGNDPPERPVDRGALERVLDAWFDRPRLVLVAGEELLELVDGRAADEPIPADDPTGPVIAALEACLRGLAKEHPAAAADPEVGGALWNALGNACRLAGPEHDGDAEAAYARALALDPENGWWRFNLGLFYKHRGRFAEGAALFARVREQVGNETPVLWNLAICATAAGDGAAAAEAWVRLGFAAELGPGGLPRVADLGDVIVRASTGGIGAAHPGRGPVDYQDVQVRPESPCHGVVLSPTVSPVGVDVGDVVLWDGAPVGYRREGDTQVPRFPLLVRLPPATVE